MSKLSATRWAVTVSVAGQVVKFYSIVATTADSAIGKARHRMRGAVSNAGEFVYHATQVGTVVIGQKEDLQ